MMDDDVFLGVDGCQKGWVSVEISEEKELIINKFTSIKELWQKYSDAKLILIDIPIGLMDKGPNPRLCDTEARKFLTRKRSSSVFPVSCRSAVYALSYDEANLINRNLTGKGISKQAWNITDKIREVDEFICENPYLKEMLIESHPEVCFAALFHNTPLNYYKKTEEGIKERIRIINSHSNLKINIIRIKEIKIKFSSIEIDDLLDALILCISASKGKDALKFLPQNYDHDSKGIPMRIAFPTF